MPEPMRAVAVARPLASTVSAPPVTASLPVPMTSALLVVAFSAWATLTFTAIAALVEPMPVAFAEVTLTLLPRPAYTARLPVETVAPVVSTTARLSAVRCATKTFTPTAMAPSFTARSCVSDVAEKPASMVVAPVTVTSLPKMPVRASVSLETTSTLVPTEMAPADTPSVRASPVVATSLAMTSLPTVALWPVPPAPTMASLTLPATMGVVPT